jgi:hypothetical protein
MPKSNVSGASPDWARRAAARAAKRGGYMATLLAAYQELHAMDDRALAQELECPVERLPLLGLCHEPRRDAGHFGADVAKLAGFANASLLQLSRLIRTVDTVRALAEEGHIAAAARDREREGADEPSDTDHP